MENKKCPLCKGKKLSKIKKGVRDNENLNVLECEDCSVQFLNNFDHIDDKFYSDSKMISTDPGINLENHLKENRIDNKRRIDFLKLKVKNKTLLDVGCGNGGFLNGIKKYCKDCSGVEKDLNYYNKFKRDKSIKVYQDIGEVKKKYDFITLFHVIEHLKDPVGMLKELSKLLRDNGRIIIETPSSNDALISHYKCKKFLDFTYISQHLFVFNKKSLYTLVAKSKLVFNYMIQVQRYNLQNHLHWVFNGKPEGHLIKSGWSKKQLNDINKWYKNKLKNKGICDTLWLEVSK